MKSPHELWVEAGGDTERYRALMVEHGHIEKFRCDRPGCTDGTNHYHEPGREGRIVRCDVFGHPLKGEARHAR